MKAKRMRETGDLAGLPEAIALILDEGRPYTTTPDGGREDARWTPELMARAPYQLASGVTARRFQIIREWLADRYSLKIEPYNYYSYARVSRDLTEAIEHLSFAERCQLLQAARDLVTARPVATPPRINIEALLAEAEAPHA
jgi:hypothetical protein